MTRIRISGKVWVFSSEMYIQRGAETLSLKKHKVLLQCMRTHGGFVQLMLVTDVIIILPPPMGETVSNPLCRFRTHNATFIALPVWVADESTGFKDGSGASDTYSARKPLNRYGTKGSCTNVVIQALGRCIIRVMWHVCQMMLVADA